MKENKGFVIDSSALLAIIYDENEVTSSNTITNPKRYFENSYMSVINATECLIVLNRNGMPIDAAKIVLESLVTRFITCDLDNSSDVAQIKNNNRNLGLSMGDCYCLALGEKLKLPVITADKAWREAQTSSEIIYIR